MAPAPGVRQGVFDNVMVARDLGLFRRAFGGVGGLDKGVGVGCRVGVQAGGLACVCILRQSGGSTLAADFLLELRAPISGGGEGVWIEQYRSHNQTECRANNEKRSL